MVIDLIDIDRPDQVSRTNKLLLYIPRPVSSVKKPETPESQHESHTLSVVAFVFRLRRNVGVAWAYLWSIRRFTHNNSVRGYDFYAQFLCLEFDFVQRFQNG